MTEALDLREELRKAAEQCGLTDCGDGHLPPIIFHYIAREPEHRGHLSTPWAFSLCASGRIFSAEEIAVRIAAMNPDWKAEKGYINITLTPYQLDKVVNELAAAFDPCKYAFVRPDDSSGNFLMEYFIYLAVQQELAQTAQAVQGTDPIAAMGSVPCTACAVENNNHVRQNDPRPAIVYAALGGDCGITAQAMYCYYKKNYCTETPLHYGPPWLQAAAEIFARQLYKIK